MKDLSLKSICKSHRVKISIMRLDARSRFNNFNRLKAVRLYSCTHEDYLPVWIFERALDSIGWEAFIVHGKILNIYLKKKS